MNFQFSHPSWLIALVVALAWTLWLFWTSEIQLSPWRKWTLLGIRISIVMLFCLALAGLQWLKPQEGLNIFYLLDRSQSISPMQQETSLKYVRDTFKKKNNQDKAGIIVFGADASMESSINKFLDANKIHAVINTERSDLASAIRLGTAAFPEHGQKRMVLLSDGNENLGDSVTAMLAAKSLQVGMDVLPLGTSRSTDVIVQKIGIPNQLKKGQTFEAKIFVQSDQVRKGTLRIFNNQKRVDEQEIELEAGKSLFTFSQTLPEPGFYTYDVELDIPDDRIPQNNRASGFTFVQGDPRVLFISSDLTADANVIAALRSIRIEVKEGGIERLPSDLAEIQSYDAIFLSNIAAGDLGRDIMLLLESAVRDFGVGLVCIGGDQSFAAGGYRSTPLENALPVSMELSSKKVLPNGALVLVVHATEFPGGNQWARDIAFAALDALNPRDEMGIVLWDGSNRWLFELTPVGDKKEKGRLITGMTPGDMPNFQPVMEKAYESLKKSTANLKHMVVFSDGDPGAPSQQLVDSIINDKITISSVMIGGHVAPQTMVWMADQGKGRFYDVNSPNILPQIFIKEAAVILKSAIFEQPFIPQVAGSSELIRGIAAQDFPQLLGYVATTPKSRSEIPLVSDKGDPILAHWQYGLGRAVAFTSDARAKWAKNWMQWEQFRQFWSQITRWALRRVEIADLTSEINIEKGEGTISVEAVDPQGNYRNFLNLQATVVNPKGEPKTVRLEQTSPGRYEAKFSTREVGTYMVNLVENQNGVVRSAQVLGISVNYSPEFDSSGSNLGLLRRLSEIGGGKLLNSANLDSNPFQHDRIKTFQPVDFWDWLLKIAILLFPLDVAVRRLQIDRAEWEKATKTFRRWLLFWRRTPAPVEQDESLSALLARRTQVRASMPSAPVEPRADLLSAQSPVSSEITSQVDVKKQPPSLEQKVVVTTKKEEDKAPPPGSTASRLLEAKKRALKKRQDN